MLLVFALLVMPAASVTSGPLSFALTIVFGLVIVWLGLGVAYFSVYPVGFFVTTFGFGGVYVLAAVARAVATRWACRPPPGAVAG